MDKYVGLERNTEDRRGGDINLLKPSGYYMHMLEHCILPTQCVCVLHMVLTINSDCFHKRYWSFN
jgi:hypothetical protein